MPTPPPRSSPPLPKLFHTRVWLWIEWTTLYILTPPLIAALSQPHLADRLLLDLGIEGFSFETGLPSGLFIFPVLLLTFLTMLLYLRADPSFENRRLWNLADLKNALPRILIVFGILAPVILFVSWFLAFRTPLLPESGFLRLPRELPIVLVFITLLYPWVSAYPQEVTHRAFFFHRYQPILGDGRLILGLNILTFSWLHIPMWNPIALLMTLPAGIIFALTYRRTTSTLAAGFEHAIYGIWAFACGLGYFVFTGSANGF
ncbi:MAG: CPBP family intramembrane metalloprotease [Phycisphaerales bacterium]|nr:CPBP family intramembrane metalloprotease [Phycisphaerales bacterium]